MVLPKDTYFEFSLSAPDAGMEQKARAEAFFKAAGIEAARVVLTCYRSQVRWSFYTRSSRELRKTADLFANMRRGPLRCKVRSLGPKDWRDRWQLYFHTMPFGSRFTIVPVWEIDQFKEKRASGRGPLFLDPSGAFGSGAHETTRLMIRMMEPLEGKYKSFLDIGTGTGVLAAAALKMGFEKIEGVDIDAASVAAAKKNFKLNSGKRQGLFRVEDVSKRKRSAAYEVVAANFISADLTACREPILRQVAAGGVLLLSGISLKNLPGFLKAFKTPGFRRQRLIRGRSWAGLLYRRLSGPA